MFPPFVRARADALRSTRGQEARGPRRGRFSSEHDPEMASGVTRTPRRRERDGGAARGEEWAR